MVSVFWNKQIFVHPRDAIEANIGHTPLIRLRRVTRDLPEGVAVFAKAEHLNPGGSVKDRPALAMILDGEQTGRLRRGMTILDATSGNTGIAYAMIGAARGYPVALCLPKNASAQRKHILRSFGVEIIETDPLMSTDGAQADRARDVRSGTATNISIRINTTTTLTGAPITTEPAPRSGNRQRAASLTSSLVWAPPVRLWVRRAD